MGRAADLGRVPRLATVPILIWLGLYLVYRIVRLTSTTSVPGVARPGEAAIACGVMLVVLLCALHLPIVLRRVTRRAAVGIMGAQAVLAYAPYAFLGTTWDPVSGLLMASILLTFTGRWSWGLAAAVAIGEFVIGRWLLPDAIAPRAVWAFLATMAVGLSCFAIVRLGDQVRRLHETRAEVARLEVSKERLRIENGLRTALGERLTSIIDDGRRAGAEPGRVAGLVATAREALAEMRSVADGYRSRSLAEEIEAALAVLTAAGVQVSADGPPDGLPEEIDAALAAVLRRTVITALRQGTPERCRIELDGSARLRVSFPDASAAFDEALAEPRREVERLGGRIDLGTAVDARIPVGRREATPMRGRAAAPWLAWAVLLAVEIDFVGTTATNMTWLADVGVARYDAFQIAAAVVALPLVSALQLYHVFPRELGAPPRAWPVTLTLQTVLLLIVMVTVGEAVPAPYTGLVAGVVLFHVRPRRLAACIVLALFVPLPMIYGTGPKMLFECVLSYCQWIVIVHALCALPVAVAEFDAARRATARMAVIKERLRVSRDVHDLLGFQLSAIVVKGELAADPRSRTPGPHLAELVTIAEEARAAVRSITRDLAGITLGAEALVARSLLAGSGIEARVDLSAPVHSDDTDVLLAIVLREAVTNVVRHSHADVCEIQTWIEDATLHMRVHNNGAVDQCPARPGTGLDNLRGRIEEAGGSLTVQRGPDTFTLTAELPHPPNQETPNHQVKAAPV
ncbi:histidine kinase [Spirillospora sp. NPDC048911]|uniref:sensor histidine kinase n=1 Tax=Spirillospora sp. NPDC048911 TaxID=3364527 RepID=UPI003723BFAC